MAARHLTSEQVDTLDTKLTEAHAVLDLLADFCADGAGDKTVISIRRDGMFVVLANVQADLETALQTLRKS